MSITLAIADWHATKACGADLRSADLRSAVYVDGYRKRSLAEKAKMRGAGLVPTSFEKKLVEVERGSWMFNTIASRLENEWRDEVQNAVNEAIGEDRACAADNAADYRRDVMRGVA